MSQIKRGSKAPAKQTDAGLKAAAHRSRISDAAYFRAEQRGFIGGDHVADWLAGEAEIAAAQNESDSAVAH